MAASAQRLNRILADTQILYGLYKKHHWQVRGATFYQLHLLLDKHAGEQLSLAVGDPRHVAEITVVPRPADGAEEVPAMLSRLLEAHEIIRTGEMQTWLLAEHLVDTPLVRLGGR